VLMCFGGNGDGGIGDAAEPVAGINASNNACAINSKDLLVVLC
jgi:hypothetical protein